MRHPTKSGQVSVPNHGFSYNTDEIKLRLPIEKPETSLH